MLEFIAFAVYMYAATFMDDLTPDMIPRGSLPAEKRSSG